MNISSLTDLGNNKGEVGLKVGDKYHGELIQKNEGSSTVRINSVNYNIKFIGGEADSKAFRLEIVKLEPLEAKIIPKSDALTPNSIKLESVVTARVGSNVQVVVVKAEGQNFVLNIGGNLFNAKSLENLSGTFQAKVVSENMLKVEIQHSLMQRGDIRASLTELAVKELTDLSKVAGAGKLLAPTAAELRQLIRNSGIFFENKLLNGAEIVGDRKYAAGVNQNDKQWQNITQMQLAAILLEEGLFSFFSSDELEEDATVRVTREDYGVSVHIKMHFVNLGKTILSVVPSLSGYNAAIHTEKDISDDLAKIEIKGIKVRWIKLKEKDLAPFDLKNKIIKKLGGFDLIA